MKIGIISDTHDNLDAIEAAVNVFNERDVSTVIHAGDLISPFTAKKFDELNGEFLAVFGNNDGEKDLLKEKFSIADFREVEYGGKKIAVYHGTVEAFVDSMVKSKKYDVVIRGHSHKPLASIEDGVLVINPGEACGYLTGKRTICILNLKDIKDMRAEIVEF
jgi:uncharacterized protein